MVNKGFVLLFSIFTLACSGKYSDPIYIPEPDISYYTGSIEVLEDELEDQPKNIELIELQLSYYDYIGWQKRPEEAVKRARKFLSVSDDIRNYLKTYYQTTNDYEQLLSYYRDLERLGVISDEERLERVDIFIKKGDYETARKDIIKLRGRIPEERLNIQLGILYGQTGNTPLSMRYFNRAYMEGTKDPILVRLFAPELIRFGYYQYANTLLKEYPELSNDRRIKELNAQVVYSLGNRDSAENIMKSIGDTEAYLTLANWYEKSLRFDSAAYYFGKVYKKDSTDFDLIVQLADVNNKRNFLSDAKSLYQKALVLDSTDNYVQNQLSLVNRKIAYLRRIREQQEEIPILNLDSKKVEN